MSKQKKSPKVPIEITAWTRCDTPGLVVAATLAGRSMVFPCNGQSVTIRLPKRPPARKWSDRNAHINCNSWRVRQGRKVPYCFAIRSVAVVATTGRRAAVSELALTRVDPRNFNASEGQRFTKIAARATPVLEQAFDYWIAVIRWKSGFSATGQLTRVSQRSGWGTYLQDAGSERHFFTPTKVFYARRERIVSAAIWRSVFRAVRVGEQIPVWHQRLIEAEQKLAINDVRGFVLDLAIAVETVARRLLLALIPERSTKAFKKMLGSLNLSRILDDLPAIGKFTTKPWRHYKEYQSGLRRIVDLRNTIMHRGESPTISAQDEVDFVDYVKAFIWMTEHELERMANTRLSLVATGIYSERRRRRDEAGSQ